MPQARLKQAVASQPPLTPIAHNRLGLELALRGEHRAALECFLAAVTGDPVFAEAWKNLGDALHKLDETEAARVAYQTALHHRALYPEAHFNHATVLIDMGRIDDAIAAFRMALNQQPDCLPAYTNLAILLFNTGRDAQALDELDQALRIAPANLRAQLVAARIHASRGEFDLAEIGCRKLLALAPDFDRALVLLGEVLYQTDRIAEAEPVLARAVEIAPAAPNARHYLGVVLKALGRLGEAREQLLAGIDLCDTMYGTYHSLSDLIDFAHEPIIFDRIETITQDLLARERPLIVGGDPLVPMHFAYAKALDDTGQHARALDHYIAGGKLERAALSYDDAGMVGICAEMKACFSKDMLASHGGAGDPGAAPVFIVGMARSGSTLVEQILASHPEIHGCGEVKFLRDAMDSCGASQARLFCNPALMRDLTGGQLTAIAQTYLALATARGGSAARIIDKLPTNYYFAGLIHLLFPNARIINTLRDPLDTCVSMFTKLFAADMPYSYDFAELGAHYCRYVDLMAHWRAVLPGGVMQTVVYEDVISDPKTATRGLLDFLGLRWNDACMDFHKTERPVKTASAAQVRKPLYNSSIGQSRKYGAGLDPLIEALRPSIGLPGGLRAG